jgi:hypothetical protein
MPRGIVLERKEDMRARGLGSPDIADALALTFAVPVYTQMSFTGRGDRLVVSDWNTFSNEAIRGEPLPESRAIGRYYAVDEDGWAWSRLKPEYE